MGIASPPNNAFGGSNNRGSSSGPMGGAPQAGRGAMPTGDRFRLPTPPADAFAPAAVAPGKGAIPVNPWDASGDPSRSATLPDDAPVPKMPAR